MPPSPEIEAYLSEAEGFIRCAERTLEYLQAAGSTEARQLYTAKHIAAMKHLLRLITAHREWDTIDVIAVTKARATEGKTRNLWALAREAFSSIHSVMDEAHEYEIDSTGDIDVLGEYNGWRLPSQSNGRAPGIGDREAREHGL